jgi:hypothetical protein
MTHAVGEFGKYDKRVLKLIERGRLKLNKRTGKAFSGLSGREIGSIKRGHGTNYVKISIPIGKRRSDGKRKYEWFNLHRAIALAFLGLPPDGCDRVNHIDANGLNNNLANLEWCSAKQNTAHAIAFGTMAQNGEDNQCSILTEMQAREILLSSKRDVDLAETYGVSYKTIQTVRYGMRWKHLFDEVSKTPEYRKAKIKLAHRFQLDRSKITRKQLRKIIETSGSLRDAQKATGISCRIIARIRDDKVWAWARKRYKRDDVTYTKGKLDEAQAVLIYKAKGRVADIAKQFKTTTSIVSKIKSRSTFTNATKGLKRG